ncbi:MAG TPA: PTS sugar transporter subunit IIA [Thermoanaerobaculia bacterium]|jgi:PTS system mannose-specific IIA component
MVGILILSHGGLAEELLQTARVISGALPGFEALALEWRDGPEEARNKVGALLPRLDDGDGVLILTDMFGSTPSNAALSFQEEGRVEVIAGVNLPMVVRLGCLTTESMPLAEMAAWIREKGRSSICGAAEQRRPPPAGAPCEDK